MNLIDLYHYRLVRARLGHIVIRHSAGYLIEQQGICDSGDDRFSSYYTHILCCECPLKITIDGSSKHGCLLDYDPNALDMLKLMIRPEES